MGQILECIRGEVTNPRGQFYHPAPNQSLMDSSLPHRLATHLNQEAVEYNTSALAKDAPIASTTFDDPVTNDTSISASTMPTSDTTASDTDPGDPQGHPPIVHKTVPMDDTTTSSLNTI